MEQVPLFWDSRHIREGNVAHVLLYVLPNIVWAREAVAATRGTSRDVTVVLPWRASNLATQVLRHLEIPYVCTDAPVAGLKVATTFDREIYDESAFKVDLPKLKRELPKRVFIPRRGTRTIVNEADLWRVLEPQGFVRVYFEDIPLPEQWAIMQGATDIVAVHGASLGAMVFSDMRREPVRVIELFGAGYIVNCYREMVALKGGRWAGIRGPITSEIVRDLDERGRARSHADDPFRVDVDLVDEALCWLKK